MLKRRWKNYLPGIVSISLGSLFLAVPPLAAMLLFGALAMFGVLYMLVVYRVHKTQDRIRQAEPIDVPFSEAPEDPSFHNVSVHMFRSGTWSRSKL